ncbi:hypothetical protein M947_11690 [Sulfurimonas hongkongensis]|uniref:AAA domain-containing protein n=1 Tax=Sulfurimonas hongkongensis TaxID=1172190 RepID=T0KLP3_9BACT|nr:ATP-binding cassette domain-containing protein [Sulfurimonas hongkongensis]EQB34293.1 hypothetical protein M947_11690 [Sulfurimonas hongkongensis]
MYKKIKKLFQFFNINQEEIPLFLKDFKITYADIQDEKSFLEKVDEKLLDFIAKELKINRDWFYENSEYIIKEESGFYKRYNFFCDEILSKYPSQLYIITQRQPNKEIDEKEDDNHFEIVAEYTLSFNNKIISRYETFETSGCRWGYWRCRWELKKLLLCLNKHHFIGHVAGYVCPENFFEKLKKFKQGELSFNDFIDKAHGYGWYPEDYIEFKTSNVQAKEEEELAKIIKELDKKSNKTIDKTKLLKKETNDYILYENQENNFRLEELAKELSNKLQTKFMLLEDDKTLYTDNEYILQLLRFDFSDMSSDILVFTDLVSENINISYDTLREDNLSSREYHFRIKWYYLYKVVADILYFYSKNVIHTSFNEFPNNESFGEKLYNLLSNSNMFKENNSWIDDFQDLKSVDPIHLFVSFNSANQKETTRLKRILALLKTFEKELSFMSSITKINLSKIIDSIEKFGIDFVGCPTPMAVHILSQRNKDDQNILWDMFFNLINAKEVDFQKIKTLYGIDITSFTIFMFWIRPLSYISLDKNTFSLLENNNKIKELPQSYSNYEKLLTKKSQLLYISLSKIGWSGEYQATLSKYEKEELDSYLKNDNDNLQELKLEKNEFELIAIKVLKNSDEKYTKNLVENHYYKLNNMYEINDDKILKKEALQNIYSTSNNYINICAIVGKNGSGKSTLAEVLFGFIYNLSINQNATKEMNQYKIIDLNLEVIFKHDVIYKVVFEDSQLEVMKYNEKDETWSPYKEFNLNQFFYTIGINYSIYANNEKLMGDWIGKIFHKNDAYQTPIVLEPFRNDGNIDINKQSALAKQRLVVNLLKPMDENKEYSLQKLRYSKDYCIAKKLKFTFNYLKIVQNENKKVSEEIIYKNNEIRIKYSEISKDNEIILQLFEKFSISQKIEFDFKKPIKEHSFLGKIQLYILKKTVTIVYRYERYERYKEFENIKELVTILHDDNSHITHKLKRAVYFLKYDLLEKKEIFEININKLSEEIDIFLSNNKEKSFHQLTPPSFYEVEILLGGDKKKKRTKEFISFDTLSSGEKQRILFINALIYHLENINSSVEQAYKYRYVNIILDEIELYYHPEYQRQHLNFLLHNLSKADISQIYGVNIIFITHSPFILTDVVNKNVLFLDNNATIKTFGANMFDIFQDGFFVENSIGSFSEEYIKTISLILSYFQAINLENIFLLRRLLGEWYSVRNENITEEEMKAEDEKLFAAIRLNKLKSLKEIFAKNDILYRKYSYLIDEKNNFIIDKLDLYIELIGDEVIRKHLLHIYKGLL